MASVWMVTKGAYSDYTVLGMFSTESLADEFREAFYLEYKLNRGDYWEQLSLSEMELDALIPESVKAVQVKMFKSGEVMEVSLTDSWDNNSIPNNGYTNLAWTRRYSEGYLCCTILTEDEATAIKITNERRTMTLANNFWNKEHRDSFNELFNKEITC